MPVYTKYFYSRTKSIENENNEKSLFLFAGLTKIYYQILGSSTRKRVIPTHSEMLEIPINDMPEYAKDIPVGTISIFLSKTEFYNLLKESENNPEVLYTYAINDKPS